MCLYRNQCIHFIHLITALEVVHEGHWFTITYKWHVSSNEGRISFSERTALMKLLYQKSLARQVLDENEFVTRPKSLNVYRFVVLFKAGRSCCPAFCWKVGKVYYDKFLHVAE